MLVDKGRFDLSHLIFYAWIFYQNLTNKNLDFVEYKGVQICYLLPRHTN